MSSTASSSPILLQEQQEGKQHKVKRRRKESMKKKKRSSKQDPPTSTIEEDSTRDDQNRPRTSSSDTSSSKGKGQKRDPPAVSDANEGTQSIRSSSPELLAKEVQTTSERTTDASQQQDELSLNQETSTPHNSSRRTISLQFEETKLDPAPEPKAMKQHKKTPTEPKQAATTTKETTKSPKSKSKMDKFFMAIDNLTRRKTNKQKEKENIKAAIAESYQTLSDTADAEVASRPQEDLDIAMALSLSLKSPIHSSPVASCASPTLSSPKTMSTTSTPTRCSPKVWRGELAFPSAVGFEETKEEMS